jgi:hypothetical protein
LLISNEIQPVLTLISTVFTSSRLIDPLDFGHLG